MDLSFRSNKSNSSRLHTHKQLSHLHAASLKQDPAALKLRFKRAVKRLIIFVNLNKSHYLVINNIANFEQPLEQTDELSPVVESNTISFNPKFFKHDRKILPDYIKKILQTEIPDRTIDMIKMAVNGISANTPEFTDYPHEIRMEFVKHAFYVEYKSGRVIMKQDNRQDNFYFILSGVCISTRCVSSFGKQENIFIEFFTQGHSLGERELIYRMKRETSICAYGARSVCLLSIPKKIFYNIISPLSEAEAKKKFLNHNVPLLNSFNYPFNDLNLTLDTTCCATYFRNGLTICSNSYTDNEWIYVIKSGKCKVLKKIPVGKISKEKYINYKNKQKILNDKLDVVKLFKDLQLYNSNKCVLDEITKKLEEPFVYLEIEELKKGDVFGLRDVVFVDMQDPNPTILVSCGAQCVLFSRKLFVKNLSKSIEMQLKMHLMPYPSENDLILSYFQYIDWNKYKKCNISNSFNKLKK